MLFSCIRRITQYTSNLQRKWAQKMAKNTDDTSTSCPHYLGLMHEKPSKPACFSNFVGLWIVYGVSLSFVVLSGAALRRSRRNSTLSIRDFLCSKNYRFQKGLAAKKTPPSRRGRGEASFFIGWRCFGSLSTPFRLPFDSFHSLQGRSRPLKLAQHDG